ncbi:MAG: glucose dehydrogenase [Chloroflexi bacterium CFX4]|nr:glucose dehydrogenase [Chloroflexi bacterium CFX4]MDL1921841.1 PQQ-dependent sugar dehydrogenase [Chloroflexi bacterium CFX3]
MRKLSLSLLVCLLCLAGLHTAFAQDPRDPYAFRFEQVGGKFDNPLYLTHANDHSGRLFVVEQAGQVWIMYEDGRMLEQPFFDINALVTDDTFRAGYTERGLLSLAFHPQYAENGTFFVYYFDRDGHTALARYRVSSDDPNRADPTSGVILLRIAQPFTDHNGGGLKFGADGYLYLSVGDGGGTQGDPDGNAQNLSVLLGKILRLDVSDLSADRYAIPPDNPFLNTPEAAPEVWAYGVRNPWRISFDRETGDLYIADVGWAGAEEVSFVASGSQGGMNFGWNIIEGNNRLSDRQLDAANYVPPFVTYDHTQGCSVTGGYVYRGALLQALRGLYFYGDYCNGNVWVAERGRDGTWENRPFKNTGRQISSFGEDQRGELYLIDYKGYVLRLRRS